jgi:hypothetical protein
MLGAVCSVLLAAGPVAAECSRPEGTGATVVRAEQRNGRAIVEVTRPNSAGRKAEVEYDDEIFIGQFDDKGKAQISFALFAPTAEFVVRLTESPPVTCKLEVPNFAKLYRVTLLWRDPVKLDLDVVEPGRRPGGFGHVNRSRPNADFAQGMGAIDIAMDASEAGGTGEISYVVPDVAAMPPGGLLTLRVDYASRGATPMPPYCGEHPRATVPFEVITIDRGQVKRSSYGVGRARCGEALADGARLMRLRQ